MQYGKISVNKRIWGESDLERLLMQEMIKWKEKPGRKPLIIHGARQVGKTWLMKEFGHRYYDNVAYINFDNNRRMQQVFDQDYDIKRILEALQIESGETIRPETTLLIFDEIQEVPQAMTALKYFCENAPTYAIVAAGSLLGMALHQGTSFPVGKVDFLHLYPLNYREFLLAVGQERLTELLVRKNTDLMNTFSDKYQDWLRKYLYLGGMPEVVQTYIDTLDFKEARKVQNNLLKYYESDFSKHAPKEQLPRIQMVWNSIPAQLSKENRKFIYGLIREGARAKDYEIAIQWLEDYGLIYKSYRVKKHGIPLISYMEQSSFKLFMLDVGLLAAKAKLQAKTILEGNQIFQEFKGALTEQYVAQELASREEELYYYTTDNSSCEIDFVLQKEDGVVPLEVKAEENLRAQSLRSYCKKYQPNRALRTSMSNYREQEWMINVPLYFVGDYLKEE